MRANKKVVRKKTRWWLKRVLTALALLLLMGTGALYLAYLYFSHDLPNLLKIAEYKPPLTTEIYASDGTIIGEFGPERRKLVQLTDIPKHVRDAFLAIEDKRFYEHPGVDLKRIIAAFLKNLEEGKIVQGGSTITQQVVKNLVFSPERSYTRKIKEAILSYRIEKNLSKDEILFIYLNHIYLGDGCYGVEAASENYFGKSVKDLNLAEAALLAALPKAPEKFSLRRYPERAKSRQELILKIMADEGLITEEEMRNAVLTDVKIVPKRNVNLETAPYFTEMVRQYLEARVGKRAFLFGGYKVFTTLDAELNLAAQWALRRRAAEVAERQGRGAVKSRLATRKEIEAFLSKEKAASLSIGGVYDAVVLEINAVESKQPRIETPDSGRGEKNTKKEVKDSLYIATLGIGNHKAKLQVAYSNPLGSPVPALEGNRPKKYAPANGYADWSLLDFVPKTGDVITVRIEDEKQGEYYTSTAFQPDVEGALLAMDTNGNILTVVGGLDFERSQFNRAIQAKRQPGSAFKPLIYAAAVDKGYSETSLLYDIPVAIKDWMPKNYDEGLLGAIPLRTALAKSRNLASIRLILDIDPSYAASYAKKFGFTSRLDPYPSLALGSSDVTLLEMVKAFNVFATGGRIAEPRFILRIYDRDGKIIEDNTTGRILSQKDIERAEREKKRGEILDQIARRIGRTLGSDGGEKGVLVETDISQREYGEDSKGSTGETFLTAEEFLEFIKHNKLLKHTGFAAGEKVIGDDTAYIMTDLLRAVITEGTGRKAMELTSLAPIAGKTGTTNDFTDAWFIGYSPKIIAGVWIGRDNHTPLGKGEAGSQAALPVWIDYMREALSKYPGGEFKPPASVRFINTPYGFLPYKMDYEFREGDTAYKEESSPALTPDDELDFIIRR
jgi:penicillin-binding protein 1A